MATMSASHARRHFGDLLGLAEKLPVRIQKNGQDVAVVLSIDEYQALVDGRPRGGVRPIVQKFLAESLEKHSTVYEALARGTRK